jgi:hypothetical protein
MNTPDIVLERVPSMTLARVILVGFPFPAFLDHVPYLVSHYHLSRENAAWYSMTVLLVAAISQW